MLTTDLSQRFTDPATWRSPGGHILSLRYLGAGTRRLAAARDALWTFPGLEGCWRRHDRPPLPASRLASTHGLPVERELFGVARVTGLADIPCTSRVLVPDDGSAEYCPCCADLGLYTTELDGWVQLGLPFAALRAALPIGRYPVDDGQDLAWRDGVDAWLREVAAHVHRAVPFDLALLGWPQLRELPLPRRPERVPEARSEGHLIPGDDGLVWFPPTVRGLVDPENADLFLEEEAEAPGDGVAASA
jgi:hypothetical protein